MTVPTNQRSNPYVMAEWLSEYEWTHFVTLITQKPTGAVDVKELVLAWIRRLESRNQARVNFVYSVETAHHQYDQAHAHVILGNITDTLTIDMLRSEWKVGFSKISLFKSDQAIAGLTYTLKDMGRDGPWDVNPKGLTRRA